MLPTVFSKTYNVTPEWLLKLPITQQHLLAHRKLKYVMKNHADIWYQYSVVCLCKAKWFKKG
jgi:hypothetical protein